NTKAAKIPPDEPRSPLRVARQPSSVDIISCSLLLILLILPASAEPDIGPDETFRRGNFPSHRTPYSPSREAVTGLVRCHATQDRWRICGIPPILRLRRMTGEIMTVAKRHSTWPRRRGHFVHSIACHSLARRSLP